MSTGTDIVNKEIVMSRYINKRNLTIILGLLVVVLIILGSSTYATGLLGNMPQIEKPIINNLNTDLIKDLTTKTQLL